MSVSGIESIGGFQPLFTPQVRATEPSQGPTGPAFDQLLVDGIEGLEGMHDRTDNLSVQAATGDLGAIHDYTIAATETSVATQLTVAVRNKAIEAFSEIMRMQVG
jgi:flagellar hook-basal body complex protein FliE